MQPWVVANPYGILFDVQNGAWHAGRVYDMLSLGTGRILVASHTGGVWYIDGAFNATPLSNDWEWPDTECLAFGPNGGNHILAGCNGAMYETDPNSPDPLHAWHSVPLPPKVSTVYRIATTREPPRVVLATDNGIWWAAGSAGTTYAWEQAAGLDVDAAFFGLARCDAGVVVGVRNSASAVVDGALPGKPLPTVTVSGIYVGQWDKTDLVMKPAVIKGLTTAQINSMTYISLATCRDHLERAYAVAGDSEGKVLALLRSTDGGRHWEPCSMKLEGDHDASLDVQSISGSLENGGPHKTISVHPTDPDVVGFGWKYALLSTDRGDSWRLLGQIWKAKNINNFATSHMHADVHAVYFEPEFTNRRLYILSDGGIVQTQDWNGKPTDFKSAMNRNLANLQFYSTLVKREFWGTLGVSGFAPLIGGGLQDNGNVWCGLVSGFHEWRRAEDGDGGWVGFINHSSGQLLANSMGDAVHRFSWASDDFQSDGTIPLTTVFGNVDADGLKGPVAEVVPLPRYRNGSGELMHAVCAPARVRAADIMNPIPLELDGKDAECRIIFGLFGGDTTPFAYWHDIGRLPPYAGTISALGTDDGGIVYAGTADGRIFGLSVGSGPPLELSVETPVDSRKESITRIVAHGQAVFAVMQSGAGAYVLRLDGLTWRILKGPLKLPFEPVYGLDINRMGAQVTLAAATESAVYVSPDLGGNWLKYNVGLPLSPHCADLRFGALEGRQVLYLSTFGRSVWMADIDAKVKGGVAKRASHMTRDRSQSA
jgi:hypothetical protein